MRFVRYRKDEIGMEKPIHIYNESKNRGKEYYEVYLAPYGRIALIHSFDIAKNGIITMLVQPFICAEREVRYTFTQYKKD